MKDLQPRAAVLGRLVAGLMLVAAGFLKLRAPAADFAAVLEGYKIFPAVLLWPAARVLPWVEYLTGIYLLAGLWLRWTAPLALVLYGMFVSALGTALARSLPLASCGCFGGWSPPPHVTMLLDSLTVLLLIPVCLDRQWFCSLDRATARPGKPGAAPRA
jgi:uncharacterized membrane protein YphA (DoxX/SURF4 family)